MMSHRRDHRWRSLRRLIHAAAGLASVAVLSCSDNVTGSDRVVLVGGSSSLYPLSEAVAEDLAGGRPSARVVVGVAGSVGGFRRLCDGDLDVAGASRPISTAEAAKCRVRGIGYLAMPITRDGVAIVANAANAAPACLTLDELARLWEPASPVTTWRDLRPALPAETIRLFGPGPHSGTFEFFTNVVVGRPGASRPDYYQTEDDNLIARGVAGDRWALGYFGSASLAANPERLRSVAVNTGFGCVLPTDDAISDGRYSPLSRDLYLYVAHQALDRPEVYEFVQHYIDNAERLSGDVGYVALAPAEYLRNQALLARTRAESP